MFDYHRLLIWWVREHLPEKMFSFGDCPKRGGGPGGGPCPIFCVIVIWSFYVIIIIKIIIATVIILIGIFSFIRAKHCFWRPKKRYKLPEMGGGTSGNAQKKTFFFSGRCSLNQEQHIQKRSHNQLSDVRENGGGRPLRQ